MRLCIFLLILFKYLFYLIISLTLAQDDSMIKAISFIPDDPEVGQQLCVRALYNTNETSSLTMVSVKDRRYWYMNRHLDFDERVIYYYESPDCMEIPQYYNYFPRLAKNISSLDQFCFETLYPEDDGNMFQWIIYDDKKVMSTTDFKIKIKLPATSETVINSVIFDPPAAILGDPFCITANYTLQPQSTLYSLHLQVVDDPPILVYSFMNIENKLYYEHPNHWSIRHDQHKTHNNTFCFKHLELHDEEVTFQWVLVDSIHYRDKFAFNFLLHYKERESTMITKILFTPEVPELGHELCMEVSFKLPPNVDLYTLHFRARDAQSIPLYWNQNPNHKWRNNFIYLHNNSLWLKEIFPEIPYWNTRANRNSSIGNKLCLHTVESEDADWEFEWILVDSEFFASAISTSIQGVKPRVSKILSAVTTPMIPQVGESVCVLIKYSLNRRTKFHRFQTKISYIARASEQGINSTIMEKKFVTKPFEKRNGNADIIERKLCFPGKLFMSEEYLYRFDVTLINNDKPVSSYSLETTITSGDTPQILWQDSGYEYGPGYIINIVCLMEDVEGPNPTMDFLMCGKSLPKMYMSETEAELMSDELHYTLQKRLTYPITQELYNEHDNFYKPLLINCEARSGKELKINTVHIKLLAKGSNYKDED